MKSNYKVTAMVPMMFSVAGNFDSEEAIKTIKEVFEMHSTTVHGFLPTQTLLPNSMANRFLSRNPTRNSTKPIFGPSLPLGLKQT